MENLTARDVGGGIVISVRRTSPRGDVSVASLVAGEKGTWRLQVDGQDHERIESPDVFMAIAQLPDLTEIRPGVITEIDAPGWSDDDLYRLADCLRVTAPDQDPEAELWDEATYTEHTNALTGRLLRLPVLDRILYVNRERWAAALFDVSILRYEGGRPVFSPDQRGASDRPPWFGSLAPGTVRAGDAPPVGELDSPIISGVQHRPGHAHGGGRVLRREPSIHYMVAADRPGHHLKEWAGEVTGVLEGVQLRRGRVLSRSAGFG